MPPKTKSPRQRTFNSQGFGVFSLNQHDIDDLYLDIDKLVMRGEVMAARRFEKLVDAYFDVAKLKEDTGVDSVGDLVERLTELEDIEFDRDELKRKLEDVQEDLDEARREVKRTEDYDEVADELEDTRHKLAELRDRVDRPCKGCGQ